MNSYIKNSLSKFKQYSLYNSINILIKDSLPDYIDINQIIKKIEYIIPNHLVYNLDSIYIGNFEHLNDREVGSIYEDGTIYITNALIDDDQLIEHIVHEIAHLVEETSPDVLYADGKLEIEFLGKRARLEKLIKHNGYEFNHINFLNPDYTKEMDAFLYRELGYEKLANFTNGLFITPYAVTSLREYFATALEDYYLNNRSQRIKDISPEAYKKLDYINDMV